MVIRDMIITLTNMDVIEDNIEDSHGCLEDACEQVSNYT